MAMMAVLRLGHQLSLGLVLADLILPWLEGSLARTRPYRRLEVPGCWCIMDMSMWMGK